MPFALLFLLSLSSIRLVAGNDLTLHNAAELIGFSNAVNSGTDFTGTTVFLDSDIDLGGTPFEPVGAFEPNYFSGTFDGQGHIIRNLAINSSSQYVGLFGYSNSETILKNVVLDSSCSIVVHGVSHDSIFIGGIMGSIRTENGPCAVENVVNEASVAFNGNATNGLSLGGIAGEAYISEHDGSIKNCANYGSVTNNGISKISYIGGIAGYSGTSYSSMSIHNCINLGSLVMNGVSGLSTCVGGIVGESEETDIDNCVNYGSIETNGLESDFIGNVIGVDYYSTISHCYWKEANPFDACGSPYDTSISDSAKFNSSFILDETVSAGGYQGTSLIGALNAAADYYHDLRDYSRWALNKDEKEVSFKVNDEKASLTLKSKIILLPDLANDGVMLFHGWYTDSACTTSFANDEVAENTELFGVWEEKGRQFTITFDTRGGSPVEPVAASFGAIVTLPSNSLREGCTVAFWKDENERRSSWKITVPARNVTLYAVWACTRIRTAEDLIDFSSAVNSGEASFEEATVFLDSDIDLSGKTFGPIGNKNSFFSGTFDGQGHAISNLVMNSSSSEVAGLFGYSEGLTIRNVILDSSCAFTGSYLSSSALYAGGIVGCCEASYAPCAIVSVVNMAAVALRVDSSDNLYLGGVAGYIQSSNYTSYLKNCANYGRIENDGLSSYSFTGGLVGFFEKGYSSRGVIQNCLNCGSVVHKKAAADRLSVGGIAGYGFNALVENCVNFGVISPGPSKSMTCVGSIVGDLASGSSISRCYWSEENSFNAYGEIYESSVSESVKFNSDFVLSETVYVGSYSGTFLIEALNAHSDINALSGDSRWVLNTNEKNVSFKINDHRSFVLKSKIILLPDLANDGKMWFDGWYRDSSCTSKFTNSRIFGDTELLGKWGENNNSYTIAFVTRGGPSIKPISSMFGSVVTLPRSLTREHCEFLFWETKNGERAEWELTVPGYNVTLFALWKCTRIKTAEDLICFEKVVNSGIANYSGATVFLDSDIDLGGMPFKPIGSIKNCFCGTFDGQGHTIGNLAINSSSQHVGLFGYSSGLVITGITIGKSSLITSSYSGLGDAYIGGIIGHCDARLASCNVENSVNNADIVFYGSVSGSLCAGGIAGESRGYPVNRGIIQNCENNGEIFFNGKVALDVHVDGIVGKSEYTDVVNCRNNGKVSAASGKHTLGFACVVLFSFFIN